MEDGGSEIPEPARQYIRTTSNRRSAPRDRNRCYALEEMQHLSDKEFQRMFRLSRHAFSFLLERILPAISSRGAQNHVYHHSAKEISPETRLAVTLRWLAGGSYLDICFAFGISMASFFKENGVMWPTLAAINDALELGFDLDPVELEKTQKGFAAFTHDRIKGCVMAIDGVVIRTRCPNKDEVSNQMSYRNRKGHFGLLVFAGCDHRCRFTMWAAKFPGSTNDCLAWPMTDFHNFVIDAGRLPSQYFIICDEAVTASEQVLSPYGGAGIGIWRDSFNYHLSAMRQCIERAFGILTRRWGIFWRPLVCAHSRWPLVCTVCAKLHNLCIDFNDSHLDSAQDIMPEDIAEGDLAIAFFNEYDADSDGALPRNADNSSTRRNNITAWLKQQQYARPYHSVHSKA